MTVAPILDALATKIADLTEAIDSYPRPRLYEAQPERLAMQAQLQGLYPAWSEYCLEHIAEHADTLATARGHDQRDPCVYDAARRLARSGFTRGEYAGWDARMVAREIASIAADIDGAADDVDRAERIGVTERWTSPIVEMVGDGDDPRQLIARMIDSLLDDPDRVETPQVMSPSELKMIRHRLGLSTRDLANLVGVEGGRTVRRWEAGDREVSGPVAVLLHAIVRHRGVRGFFQIGDVQEAAQEVEEADDADDA